MISRSPSSQEFDSQKTLRSRAMSRVPFSSVFYCSNPLAAALTRRRTQLFFLALAVVGNLSEFWPLHIMDDFMLQKSKHLKFTNLQSRIVCPDNICRDGPACPGIRSFGLTLNGQPLQLAGDYNTHNASITLDLKEAIEWNGWYFETDASDPGRDAIRFMLEAKHDGQWETVGSSSWAQVDQI